MKSLITIILGIYGYGVYCQTPGWSWAKSFAAGPDNQEANSIAIDSIDNIYITGDATGFTGLYGGFVAKYDSQGDLDWVKSFNGGATGTSISIDSDGFLLITGYFSGNVDFDPGPDTLMFSSTSAFEDVFVVKMDFDGNLIWAKTFGGDAYDEGNAIDVDILGNVYVGGFFWTTVDFDPGDGVHTQTTASTSDAFILKLNSEGEFQWVSTFLGEEYKDEIYSLSVDSVGNVYSTGIFWGTTDFDPGEANYYLSTYNISEQDIFITKLDSNGSLVWAKSIGGPQGESSNSLVLDNQGHFYITGQFGTNVDFDPDPNNVFELTTPNYVKSIFVAKFNLDGIFSWAKKLMATSNATTTWWNFGNGAVTDSNGNVFITGTFGGTMDFDPNEDAFEITSNGSAWPYIEKLDSDGNFQWVKIVSGGQTLDRCEAIALSSDNYPVITGKMLSDTMSFDSIDVIRENIFSNGSEIFLAKMGTFIPNAINEPILSYEAITVYPNPAQDKIFIYENVQERVDLSIIDPMGNLIFSSNQFGGAPYTIDVSSWSSGLYLIRYSYNGVHKTERLIVVPR